MNHEIEAYPGELRRLRNIFKFVYCEMVGETHAFSWHKIQCGQCGVNADLLQRNDGRTMCRQCWQDHFEESHEPK